MQVQCASSPKGGILLLYSASNSQKSIYLDFPLASDLGFQMMPKAEHLKFNLYFKTSLKNL